jgi:hypothetical protein
VCIGEADSWMTESYQENHDKCVNANLDRDRRKAGVRDTKEKEDGNDD